VSVARRPRAVALPAAARRLRAIALPSTSAGIALGLGALVAASLVLRSTALHARYWIDEGLSVGIAQHPLADIPGLLLQDGSPPLYYLLLGVWVDVAGYGEADTHVLSLAFALLTVPAAFAGGRALFGARAGWLAAALAALNPYLTYYAQETRMYALVALLGLVVAATFALVFVQRRRAWLWGFTPALALLVYTHNWGLFLGAGTLAALALLAAWAGGGERRALLRDARLAYGAVALAYLPWVPSLLAQVRRTGAPWSERPNVDAAFDGLGLLMGGTAPAVALLVTCLAGAGALLSAEWGHAGAERGRAGPRRAGPRSRALLAIGAMTAVALVLAWTASQVSHAWAPRYLAVLAGPLLLLVAAGLAHAGRLAIVALVIVALFWIDPRTSQLEAKSNAHTTAVLVRDRLEPGDLVVSTHPEHTPVMRLYLGGGYRWATSTGPVADPRIMDWRDAVDRLRAARPAATAEPLVASLRPGQRLLLVQPIIRSARWSAPWTALVRRRAAQWERRLNRDPRLVRTLAVPRFGEGPVPRGVRAVLYEVPG
jgi:mannosyltransferase